MSPNPVHRLKHSLPQIARVVIQIQLARMKSPDLLVLGIVAGQMGGFNWASLAEYFNRHLQRKETLQPENNMYEMGVISLWTQSMPRIPRVNLPGLD
jgi:hypothetical protein